VHTAISCNDNDACTVDSCVPATGCEHQSVAPPGSIQFDYTGAPQSFVVPDCVTAIRVDAFGAAGGTGQIQGGLGGRARATVPVTPGTTLLVYVGGSGFSTDNSPTGGWNGGGGVMNAAGPGPGGTGGGASDVRATADLGSRLVVAGGGGGGGAAQINGIGGAGGGLAGGDGTSSDPGFAAGGGGSQVAGGAVGWWNASYPNQPGSFGVGGTGYQDSAGCGGGGGGWYGGGTGGFAGGGGGSGYVDAPGNTNTSMEIGVRAGNGVVTINW
jgi:hypothetical protein